MVVERIRPETRHYDDVRRQTNNLRDDRAILTTGMNALDCIPLKSAAEQLGYNVTEPPREFTDDRGYPCLYELSRK